MRFLFFIHLPFPALPYFPTHYTVGNGCQSSKFLPFTGVVVVVDVVIAVAFSRIRFVITTIIRCTLVKHLTRKRFLFFRSRSESKRIRCKIKRDVLYVRTYSREKTNREKYNT